MLFIICILVALEKLNSIPYTMKRVVFYLFILAGAILLNSCSKIESDDAETFVGTYNVSVIENVVWGNDSGTLNDNGTIVISKLSANRVSVRGYISTEGEVNGSSLFLEGTSFSDSYGYLTVSFGEGTLSGNVLTFSAVQTGQLSTTPNGTRYPFRNVSYFTAIKQ